MKYTTVANLQWADSAHTAILVDVTFDKHGVLPFGASASDVEPHGREIFNRAVAGDFGPIAAYVAPPAVIPTVVTMRQARLAMLDAGILTSVSDVIAAMTGPTGEAARIEWEYATSVDRGSALVTGLSASLNLTSVQLDSLFTTAATL